MDTVITKQSGGGARSVVGSKRKACAKGLFIVQNTDILTGAKLMSFEEGMAAGLIEYVGEDCKEALYDAKRKI